ncbi:MAG: 1-acyl-sn-glycerol-3-phosphate acyltransferase [Clostridiales bacterium]|nr:1-acyl-sn-glycerol-3-phosphate acyltransferase [Clostridiales bacterium]
MAKKIKYAGKRVLLAIFIFFYPVKVLGKKNLPDGGALIVSNHFSAIDPAIMHRVYYKDIYFLAKKEIYEKKIWHGILNRLGAIPIDRENVDLPSMMKAIRTLKEGHKLVVYPEGTRNKTGSNEIQEVKAGAVLFSIKAKKPIVPVIAYKKSKLFRRTYLYVGEPFEFSEFYDKKLTGQDYKELDVVLKEKMVEARKTLIDLVENGNNRSKK